MKDLFDSILFLDFKRRINMEEVLKCPVTQVPLSLTNVE